MGQLIAFADPRLDSDLSIILRFNEDTAAASPRHGPGRLEAAISSFCSLRTASATAGGSLALAAITSVLLLLSDSVEKRDGVSGGTTKNYREVTNVKQNRAMAATKANLRAVASARSRSGRKLTLHAEKAAKQIGSPKRASPNLIQELVDTAIPASTRHQLAVANTAFAGTIRGEVASAQPSAVNVAHGEAPFIDPTSRTESNEESTITTQSTRARREGVRAIRYFRRQW